MENLNQNQLCEINAGGGKEIYASIWSTIAGIATGGNQEIVKAAGLAATQQFEFLEGIFNNFKGLFANIGY